MSQLLKMLYAALDRVPPQDAETQAVKAASPAVQAAEKKLSYQEFENLWNAISDIEHATYLDSFVLGYRIGVQLTLEGLRPVYPTDPAASAARPCPPQ